MGSEMCIRDSSTAVAPSATTVGTASDPGTGASSAAVASAAAAAAVAAAAAASAAAASGKLYAECAGVLFVEDIERRQADVRDFLLTECDVMTHSGAFRRHMHCRATG